MHLHEEALQFWEPHDLEFHRRSRVGYGVGAVGATMRFEGHVDPLPSVKPASAGSRIALPAVDLDAIAARDASFQSVLDRRRSVRSGTGAVLTAVCLSEFLYRSTHVQASLTTGTFEMQKRPYPSGGALHELEIYLTIRQAADLDAGLYHYQPIEHALYALPSATAEQRDRMLELARLTTRAEQQPGVLITLAARIGRVAWKYEGMVYRTILLNAGVLLQTMYLVATAMTLAPCAIGNGDSPLFADAAGVSDLEEPAVAEFALWI